MSIGRKKTILLRMGMESCFERCRRAGKNAPGLGMTYEASILVLLFWILVRLHIWNTTDNPPYQITTNNFASVQETNI